MPQCVETTKAGKQCAMQAVAGGEFCAHHNGTIDHVSAARKGGQAKKDMYLGNHEMPKEAINEALRRRAEEVYWAALHSKNPSTQLAASAKILSIAPEKPVSESQKKGWQTTYAGVPTKDVAAVLKAALEDQPLRVLPSPGEILSARPNRASDGVSTSRGS